MLPNIRGDLLDDYLAALRGSHEYRVSVEVYDLDDNFIQRYDADELPLVDGQVDVDEESAIERALSASFVNVSEVSTDPTSPGAALSSKRQIKVIVTVFVPRQDGSVTEVEVPVFYGPISRVQRDSEEIQIEAQSKEAFFLPPNRLLRSSIPSESDREAEQELRVESYYVGHIIKTMAKRHGERMMRVPRTDHKIPEDSKLFDRASQDEGAWPLMQSIAGSRQLYYSADGYLTLRTKRTQRPAYVFSDGEDGNVMSDPVIEWDMSTFRNTVELHAFQRKNANEKENPALRVQVSLEPWHPLSPRSLSRNNHARELVEIVDSDNVYNDESVAKRDANDKLDRLAHESKIVEFDCLPVYHLEVGDLVAVDLKGQPRHRFIARKFSLPLTPNTMSMGYNRKINYRRHR